MEPAGERIAAVEAGRHDDPAAVLRVSGNFVSCIEAGSTITDTVSDGTTHTLAFEGLMLTGLNLTTFGAGGVDNVTPDALLSNKLMDKLYNILNRRGAGHGAYGKENGRPVYSIVLSSEAS